jgi:hypothetical protein
MRSEGEHDPEERGQRSSEEDVAAAATAEEGERVSDDAGEGFEVPGEADPEEERSVGRAADVQLVLEQVLEGDAAEHLRLSEGGREDPDDDEDCRVEEGRPVGFAAGLRRGDDFLHE